MYRLTDYGAMLEDSTRMAARTRALQSAVTPESVVLDLGTGIGTFAMLAARLGAARVYAVDLADVVTAAEAIARANGLADRIRFIQARASELELPERVDVIISDLCGALPLFDDHIPSIQRVRDRFLAPGGVLIPARDRLLCAPVSNAEWYARLVAPWRSLDGVDLSAGEAMALNATSAARVLPEELAAPPQCWAELDYATIDSPHAGGEVEWTFDGVREVHAIALWFESTLAEGVTYSTGPWAPASVHGTILLPLRRPLRVERTLTVSIRSTLAAGHYQTTWQAGADGTMEPRQSTFLSEPRSGASLLERAETGGDDAERQPEALRLAEQVLSRPVGDEMLLFDPRSGLYHVLNETGARVWHGLEARRNVEAIAAELASEFDVDPRQAEADVGAVVARLQEAKLIE